MENQNEHVGTSQNVDSSTNTGAQFYDSGGVVGNDIFSYAEHKLLE